MPRKRYAWLTPNNPAPGNDRCRVIRIPNDLGFIAAVSGALLPLTMPQNWEQHGALTPEQAADAMFLAYADMMQETLTDDCGGGGPCARKWRQNPADGRWQTFDEELETWEFPDGQVVESLPLPAIREEPTEGERVCLASANAVNVIYQTWLNLLDSWDSEVEEPLAQVAVGVEIAGAIGGAFYPPLLAVAGLMGAAFTAFFELFAVITIDTWSSDFLDDLKCIFKNNATTDETGRVLFHHVHIIRDMNMKTWYNSQYLLAAAQFQFIASWLGSEALNVAGGTTAITEADCTCGVWGREWLFGAMHEGDEWARAWGLVTPEKAIEVEGGWPGRWAAVRFTVPVSNQTHFLQVGIRYFVPAGQYHQAGLVVQAPPGTPWLHSGNPDDAPYSEMWALEYPAYHADTYSNFTIDRVGSGAEMTFTFFVRHQGEGTLRGIRIYGEGPCPFATGTML